MDSATPQGGVALLEGGEPRGVAHLQGESDHVARLPEAVARLLETAGWRAAELDLVVVTLGPGSFTGVRIALGVGKGLALGLGIPLAGVGTLELLATATGPGDGVTVPVLDARRGELFAAGYGDAGVLHPQLAPRAWKPEALADALAGLHRPLRLIGPGVPLLRPWLDERGGVSYACSDPVTADPVALARWGVQRLAQGGLTPAALLEPVYLRRSEAEEKRLAAQGGGVG